MIISWRWIRKDERKNDWRRGVDSGVVLCFRERALTSDLEKYMMSKKKKKRQIALEKFKQTRKPFINYFQLY